MSNLILAVKSKSRKIFVNEFGLEWIGAGLHSKLIEYCDLVGATDEVLIINIKISGKEMSVEVNQDCKFFNESIEDWSPLSKHSCELVLKASLLNDLYLITLPLENTHILDPYMEFVKDIYQEHTKNKSTSDFCFDECQKVKKIINTLSPSERNNAFAFLKN